MRKSARTTKPAKSAKPAKPPSVTLERNEIPWLLAVSLATTMPHASHLPLWLSLLAGAITVWRGGLWYRNAPLPKRWPLGLLIAGSVGGILWEFHTLFGKESGVALLVVFMALKQMEMRTRRDALVAVMLGFFLLLTHYFDSQSIPTGLWLLCATTLLTATLIRLHGGNQPLRATLRYAGLLLAQAIPFMVILFLLFPRISGPLWGLPRDAYSGMTGLSDQMSPGSMNNLIQSGAIAFRVQFAGERPKKSQLYWRGPVLDDYDGKTWRTHTLFPRKTDTPPKITYTGKTFAYVTTLEAHNQSWLLALDLPITLPEGGILSPTLETLTRARVRARTRYSFTSAVDFVANREENPRLLQQALRLPPKLNPRTIALAQTWQTKLTSAEQISNAALNLFRQEAFFYTLRPPLLNETNGIDDFLFGTRRGFCEHYASAYVFLMRAAGVPARVVTGYQGGEINPVDGYLVVRQSDAHAWAEIWLAERGWVRVDPTAAVAPSRIEQGIESALPQGDPLPVMLRIDTDWLRSLRNQWEAANNGWNQWVLGYNPQLQREVLSRLGLNEPDWRSMSAALASLCGMALLLVTLWTLYQRNAATPAQRAWQAYCKALAKRGIPRADWEGPLEFSRRVTAQRPELGALTQKAAKHFADLHYGHGKPIQLELLEECVRKLSQLHSPPKRIPPTSRRNKI